MITLIDELFRLGVDRVKVRTIRSSTNEPAAANLRRIEDALARLSTLLRTEGILVGKKTLEVDVQTRYVPLGYQCQLSPTIAVIDPTGDIHMCWNDLSHERDRVIGNVFAKRFSDIWGSKRHREVCASMNAEVVCNSPAGCHCRLVGYQDIYDRMVPFESNRILTGPALLIDDNFF